MKLFTSLFLLALVSTPAFCALSDDTKAILLADDATDSGVFLSTLMDGSDDDSYDAQVLIATDTTAYLALLNANVLAAVLSGMGTTQADQIDAIDVSLGLYRECAELRTTLEAEVSAADKSLCECGGVFTVTADAAAACTTEAAFTADDQLVVENWLGATKIGVTGGDEIPGMLSTDVALFKTGDDGVWETVSCFADDTATVISQCGTDYDILRALWDSADVTDANLTDGGLDPLTLGGVLYQYEQLSQAEDFAAIAALFNHGVVDDADAVWSDDLQTALGGLFCTGGTLNTAAETVTAVADFAEDDGDFYRDDFADFLTAGGWDLDVAAADLTDAQEDAYLWLDSICPQAGSTLAENIDAWIALFTELSADAFALAPNCSEFVGATTTPLLVDLTEGDEGFVEGDTVGNKACPPCRADDADALTDADDDFAYDGFRNAETGSLHFCITATGSGSTTDGSTDDSTALDPTVMPDCDEDQEDETADDFCTAEMLAIIKALDEASGRGFAMGISLLAALALLWK